ncbi:protein sidekick-2 isoform 1, partial [Cricetulus griseus]
YVWEKDGATLAVETNPRIRLDRNGSLHISQTWSGDIGTYTCRVLSAGGNDSRNAHLRVRVSLPEEPPTAPPQNVIASGRTNQSIMIQWQPPPESHQNGILKGYIIRYCLAGLPVGYQFKNITDADVNNLLLEDLIIWTNYEIEVAAYNSAGLGVYSSKVTEWTLQGVPTVPPGNVHAEATNSTTIRFTWNAPSPQFINGINQGYKVVPGPVGHLSFNDILDTSLKVSWQEPGEKNGILTGYRISWEEYNRTNTRVTHYLPNVTLEYRVTGLTALTTYTIEVAAMTSKGQGQVSASTISSGVPPELPGAPTNLGISNIGPRSVTLQFRPGYDGKTSISRWVVEAQVGVIGEGEEWLLIYQLSNEPDARSMEVPDLNPFTYYSFRMRQVNIVGTSPPSQPSRKIQTLQAPPDMAPANVTLRTASETSLWLRWMVRYKEKDSDSQPRFWLVEGNSSRSAQLTAEDKINGILLGFRIRYRELLYEGLRGFTLRGINNPGAKWAELTSLYSMRNLTRPSLTQYELDTYQITHRLNATTANTATVEVLAPSARQYMATGLKPESVYLFRITAQTRKGWGEAAEALVVTTEKRDLSKHKRYEIRMSVYNAVGEGPLSPPQEVFVGEAVPTAAPQNVAIHSATATQLDVTWEPPPLDSQNGDIQGYKIYFWEVQRRNLTERVKTLFLAENSVKLKNLTGYTAYMVSIAAFNAAGDGPRSTPTRGQTQQAAPSAPGSVKFSELTTTSVNVSWEAPQFPNGPLEGYRLVYEPCTPVDGVSKIVTVDVKGTGPLWLKVKDLAEGMTYRFRIKAKTFTYGPEIEANITTGPGEALLLTRGSWDIKAGREAGDGKKASEYPEDRGSPPPAPQNTTEGLKSSSLELVLQHREDTRRDEGAPGPPGVPIIVRYSSAIAIHWSSGDPGKGPITRYVIEARPSDEGLWDILIKDIPKEVTSYTFSMDILKPGVSYDFRVIAVNDYGFGTPSSPSQSVPAQKASPFYEEWWFLVVIALVGLIFILLLVFVLIIRGQSKKYSKKTDAGGNTKSGALGHGEMLSLDESSFPALELNNRRLSVKNSFCRKNGLYTRSPPRPSPGSLHYSDEDVTKYNDLIPAESSSLTEKPSEISDSQGSDSEYEVDTNPQKAHSFVNHYISDPTYYNSWRRQQKGISRAQAYSYTESDSGEPDHVTVPNSNSTQQGSLFRPKASRTPTPQNPPNPPNGTQ